MAVFGLAGVLIIAEIALAYQTTMSNQTTDNAVAYTLNVVKLINQAQTALADMEAGYRGYLLTGDDSFLRTYTAGSQTARDLLQQLERQTARNAAQVARWQTLEHQLADWQTRVTEPMLERRRGLAPDQIGQLISVVKSRDDSQRLAQMRGVFDEAIASEEALLAQRRQQQAEADGRLLVVLIWGTAAAVLLALGLGAWILRQLERERLAGVWLAIQTSEHELYNRLSVASGRLQLLLREPELSSRQRSWAERAHGSVLSAADVVRRMREMPQLRETRWSSESGVRTINLDS